MPLTDSSLNYMADQWAASVTEVSLHTADPGTTGANESTAGRQVPAFSAAANGDLTVSGTESFTGGAANGACTYVGFWRGATFAGGFALTGDQTFNAAGEYTLTDFDLAGSST